MTAVTVSESSQTFAARRAATNLAAELLFNETETGKVAIIVTEMATNLIKHAGSGTILLRGRPQNQRCALEILAVDSGPGMENPDACLRDGVSAAGSSGTGLGAISRLATLSEIYTLPGHGTIIRALCAIEPAQPAPFNGLDVGGVAVPVTGETECGDAFAVCQSGDNTILMMADGLGHGPLAAVASRAAVDVLPKVASLEVAAILEAIHQALRGSRGAAVSVASINPGRGTIRYTGVGNIVGALVNGAEIRHFVSMHGIVGQQIRTPRCFDYEWNPESIVVLHSDGVSSNWTLQKYPGITRKSASIIAASIWRAAHRRDDDASVLVLKAGLPA
ncbi:MAG: ATP-binding SpoIIE family protein phosphatase [Bryobacteraceae bacterium]|nr:ATP-binding SpoIIE family protein phosphatase [Bryobacteraceae bacterium]